MSRSGKDFFATAVEAAATGEKRISYQVGLVYGSGNKRDEMYFTWKDDHLFLLPVAWLVPYDCWGTAMDSMPVLRAGPACLQCHNTWMAHVPGTSNQFHRNDLLLGVTCERCHGPGREHVEYHRQHPMDNAHAILHPGTLSRERLMDVCAQCHGNTRIIGMPFSYRPGQPLVTAYRTVQAKYREDDTTTNQVQYLSESKCFKKSKMTCITCHDPHFPTSAKNGCMACHTAASCTDQPKQPAAVRGDCVGCHMPQLTWMNSHFYTTKDEQYLPVGPRSEHRIGVYPQAKQAVILAWLRKQPGAKSQAEADHLAAELNKYWLNEADQLNRAGRFKAAIAAYREALHIAPNPTIRKQMQEVITHQVELDDLFAQLTNLGNAKGSPDKVIDLLQNILQIKPDEPRAHSELGKIYAEMGKHAEAIPHLQAVAKYDPTDSSGVTRLAWIALIEGRPEEAAELCAQADKIEPVHPLNHQLWGKALLKLWRWADAEKHFRTALKSNPTIGGANQGLSEALRQQGKAEEAIVFAKRAVHWSDSKNVEVLLTLADAYAAAKRLSEARKTLEKAQALAQMTNLPLATEIGKRLNQLH
jgi:tetratricopeptide (TPR) repeat protein